MQDSVLTEKILGCCFRVHTELGPGLLESLYEECVCRALSKDNIQYERQKDVPVCFDGELIKTPLRLDILVENKVVLELKSVKEIQNIHFAQLQTYMKLSKVPIGLLVNFNVMSLKEGIHRRVLNYKEEKTP